MKNRTKKLIKYVSILLVLLLVVFGIYVLMVVDAANEFMQTIHCRESTFTYEDIKPIESFEDCIRKADKLPSGFKK